MKKIFFTLFVMMLTVNTFAFTNKVEISKHTTATDIGEVVRNDLYATQIEFTNVELESTDIISYKFDNIAHYDSIDFILNTSGTDLTTANVDFVITGDYVVTANTLTETDDLLEMHTNTAIVTIYNTTGGTINVSGNILITND